MTNRVVMGRRNPGEQGLWISKPGKDVLTISNDSDFLFKTDFVGAQVVQSGRIAQPGETFVPFSIYLPDLGYKPFVDFESIGHWAIISKYLSNTEIRFQKAGPQGQWGSGTWNAPPFYEPQYRWIVYRVWSVRVG